MGWETGLIIVGVVSLLLVLIVLAIRQDEANQKKIDEKTIKKMDSEQVREFLAEHLGVKPSQVKFRINDGNFFGIRVLKYIEE